MNRKWISTVLVMAVLTFSSFTLLGSLNEMNLEEKTKEQSVFDTAVNLIKPPSEAQLVRFDKGFDYERNCFVWFLEWKFKNDLMCVEVDDRELEILYYLDTSKTSQLEFIPNTESIKPEVLYKVQQLLTSMTSLGIEIIPSEAYVHCIKRTTHGWYIIWGHEIDSVPLKNDEISLSVDRSCSSILSYKKVWNNIRINTVPTLSSDEVGQIIDLLQEDEFIFIDSKLVIINPSEVGIHYLAYEVTITTKRGETLIYQIDAHMGNLLDCDMMMGGYQDVFVNIAYTADYYVGYSIYKRLETSTYSTLPTRFYVDVGKSTQRSLIGYEQVFYNLGHGDLIEVGNEFHSTIVTPTGDITPSDILYRAPLVNMKLAFIASCVSFSGEYHHPLIGWRTIDYGIANAFLDAGADCVFGWCGLIGKDSNWAFCKHFFNKVVNGYDFDCSFQYAHSKISADQRFMARIAGDTSLTLTEDEQGADYYPGTYLGYSSAIEWKIYDEGLWGVGLDIDWYRFRVTTTRQISIHVAPIIGGGNADFVIKVYDCYMNLKYTVNNNGLGQGESISFTGFSTYYLKIYTTGSGTGGAYDLSILISS